MRFTFDDVELDTDLYEIRTGGQPVHVEPKVFDLLAHLVQHPGVVLSHDDLIEAVWHGRTVSDAAIVSNIANARKAIGDSGRTQRYIKTVRGRGFRFTGEPTSSLHANAETVSTRTVDTDACEAVLVEPRLLILPFRLPATSTTAADGTSYVQSLTSTLEIVLMRIPLLQLSSFSLVGDEATGAPSTRSLYTDHGIDFTLEGSVRLEQGRLVLDAQLSDTRRAVRLWAERLEIDGDYRSALEPSVIGLVTRLEPQLHRAMSRWAQAIGDGTGSRALYLEASSILALKGWHHDSFLTASALLRKSWQQDPRFAHAASYLSLVLGLGYRLDLLKKGRDWQREVMEAADTALELDDMNSSVLGLAGCALADLGFLDRALPILRSAIELNPSNAQARCALGGACLSNREVDTAIAHLRQGMRMSPLDSRLNIWSSLLSSALRASGDLDGAVKEAELACQYDHRAYMPRVVLAGALLVSDAGTRALAALAEARRIKPDLNEAQVTSLLGNTLGKALLAAARG